MTPDGLTVIEAGLWGLLGGAVVLAVDVARAIHQNKNVFPWLTWRAMVGVVIGFACRLFASMGLAAAMSQQITGYWPAFVAGVTAPLALDRLLSGVTVAPSGEPSIADALSSDPPGGEEGPR